MVGEYAPKLGRDLSPAVHLAAIETNGATVLSI